MNTVEKIFKVNGKKVSGKANRSSKKTKSGLDLLRATEKMIEETNILPSKSSVKELALLLAKAEIAGVIDKKN